MSVLKGHSFREFGVFKICEPLESGLVKIDGFRELRILEISILMETRT